MTGKKLRLSKIINPETKRTCIVPMDHGVTLGPIDGLDRHLDTLISVVNGGADAVVLHKGLFKVIADYPEVVRNSNFILHLSASTNLSRETNHKHLVSTVEQAVKMGAIGVSIHVNLGSDSEGEMIEDLGLVSDACMDWGMPLLAMMYVRGNNLDSYNTGCIAHAAKVAEEIGADIIKVNSPLCPKDIRKVIQCVNTPVVVAGGPKMTIHELLDYINEVLEAGVSGVSIGRNIFQTNNPEATTKIIYGMVHNRLSYKDAVNKITKEVVID